MSTHTQRTAVPTVMLSLADRIRMAGVEVREQEKAPHLMEVIRIGLPHDTTPQQLRRRKWFSFRHYFVRWHISTVQDFNRHHTYRNGPLPDRVQEDVLKIEQHLPGVELRIHSLAVDPWLIATENRETVYVRGWDKGGVFF